MYIQDPHTKEIVINGWEKGIADDPYSGISDIRNMNLISVPKEASVNFVTSKISYPTVSLSITTTDATGDTVTVSNGTGLEGRMSIVFSARSSAWGITVGTVYWIGPVASGVTFQLFTDQALTVLVDITANSGTGTAATLNPTKLLNWAYDRVHSLYYAVDSTGYVWGNNSVTATNSYWTFTGNVTITNANGKGLVCYQTSNQTVYLFVFRNGLIDYALSGSPLTWTYGWNPTDASTANTGSILNTLQGVNNSHQALVGQDNKVYYCDSNYIGSFSEISGKIFLPTDLTTYTPSKKALTLPFFETAQCLAELGVNLLIGGIWNQIYPWDRTSTNFKYPILLAENNVFGMITINTNTFVFMGNRGRIYITNGTSAQLYKKVPDHLSGTVEPYFTWGGACSIKNQLYFCFSVTTNGGVAISQYSGVWAIDMDTKAIRLTNQLSYGTYAGGASIIFPNFAVNPAGTGLYIGWYDGVSIYGIDQTLSTPYTNYQSYIDTDNIPIGTLLKPTTLSNIEWKLLNPLVSGEGIKISYRLKFSDSFTLIWENTTIGTYSDYQIVNFENAQWVQFRIETKSTSSSPSYVRLTELRLRN